MSWASDKLGGGGKMESVSSPGPGFDNIKWTYMYDKFAHFSEHGITIVPNCVKPENFPIHLNKLSQLVKV